MPLSKRQLIIGTAKKKDRYLYEEISCGLYNSKNNNDEEKNLLANQLLILSKMKDEVGQFILHHACKTKEIPEYVINVLVTNNRVAVQTKSDDGDYPLRLSLQYGQAETVVLQLLQTFQEAVQSIDNFCQDPLHIAVANYYSEIVVRELIKVFPEAARHRRSVYGRCRYPLHWACAYDYPEPLILELIKVFPEAAKHPDNGGWYSLHLACRNNTYETVVHELIKLFPEAIKQKVYYAGYPLHIACAKNAAIGVIKALVFHYPEALHIVATPHRHNKRPYDLACKPHRFFTPIRENVEYLREVTTSRKKTLRQFNKKPKLNL